MKRSISLRNKSFLPLCVSIALALALGATTPAQVVPQTPGRDEEVRLPSGSLQKDEILKEDFKKTLDDAAKLLQLAEDLKIELEKNERHVLSISSLKKTEEIEKIAKRIRGRLRRSY
jgi:hypothetical protein